jgi:hypothetical protein
MAVNRELPHLFVLPEDDANRQMANGFHQRIDRVRQMQVLRPAGGWTKVLTVFGSEYVTAMERNANMFVVLMIDLDENSSRLDQARAAIPHYLADRVFILSTWSRPEKLKPDLGTFEAIGLKVAEDCRNETDGTTRHDLLRHNLGELNRLRQHVLPFLAPSS